MMYCAALFFISGFFQFFFPSIVATIDVPTYTEVDNDLFSEDAFDSGGWKAPDTTDTCSGNHCDFKRYFDIELNLANVKQPAVIVSTNIKDIDHWKKNSFQSKYGQTVVEFGSGVGIATFDGSGSNYMRIEDLLSNLTSIEEEHKFVFDSKKFFLSHPELLKDIKNPLASQNHDEWWPIFSLGGNGDGLPFHSHGPTWLHLIYGTKRWFAYPPGMMPIKALSNHSLQTVDEWLIQNYPTLDDDLKPFQCIQHPGEIVYLPEGWSHATFNLGESIAIGQQAPWSAEKQLKFAEKSISEAKKDPRLSLAFAFASAGRALLKLAETETGFSGYGFKMRGLQHFKTALQLRPNDLKSLFVLSRSELRKEDRISSRKTIEELLSDEVGRGMSTDAISTGLHRLGRDYVRDGEIEKAALLLGWAADLAPYSSAIALEAGAAFFALEHWEDAQKLLSRAMPGLDLLPLDNRNKKEVRDMLEKARTNLLQEII